MEYPPGNNWYMVHNGMSFPAQLVRALDAYLEEERKLAEEEKRKKINFKDIPNITNFTPTVNVKGTFK